MSGLDLSKAYEAGHKADWTVQDAARIIDAALPHILEALAEQADEDAPCDHGCAAETIPAYLREKAEETRA